MKRRFPKLTIDTSQPKPINEEPENKQEEVLNVVIEPEEAEEPEREFEREPSQIQTTPIIRISQLQAHLAPRRHRSFQKIPIEGDEGCDDPQRPVIDVVDCMSDDESREEIQRYREKLKKACAFGMHLISENNKILGECREYEEMYRSVTRSQEEIQSLCIEQRKNYEDLRDQKRSLEADLSKIARESATLKTRNNHYKAKLQRMKQLLSSTKSSTSQSVRRYSMEFGRLDEQKAKLEKVNSDSCLRIQNKPMDSVFSRYPQLQPLKSCSWNGAGSHPTITVNKKNFEFYMSLLRKRVQRRRKQVNTLNVLTKDLVKDMVEEFDDFTEQMGRELQTFSTWRLESELHARAQRKIIEDLGIMEFYDGWKKKMKTKKKILQKTKSMKIEEVKRKSKVGTLDLQEESNCLLFNMNSWKARYVEVHSREQVLKIYEKNKEEGGRLLNLVPLSGVRVQMKQGSTFSLQFPCAKSVMFRAKDEKERNEWIRSLVNMVQVTG